jgi:hypothetical protein
MFFHQVIFFSCQFGGFVQDGIGDSDFSDVVQQRRDLDVAQLILIEPALSGNVQRRFRQARAVTPSVQVQ